MIVGKVVGTVVATRKNENLVGCKFLIVEPFPSMGASQEPGKSRFVAVDHVGAGVGEVVIVAKGSAARIGTNRVDSPIDAAIVGIVDNVTELE
ncbi:ethanolamine utilization protein EutN [Anaerotaenia torta]|uniref:EutN/CcmL family microcompartment protein n=1 Tax=Anaerotaenia torta TaxID=433293 RepID=UPI003D19034A